MNDTIETKMYVEQGDVKTLSTFSKNVTNLFHSFVNIPLLLIKYVETDCMCCCDSYVSVSQICCPGCNRCVCIVDTTKTSDYKEFMQFCLKWSMLTVKYTTSNPLFDFMLVSDTLFPVFVHSLQKFFATNFILQLLA